MMGAMLLGMLDVGYAQQQRYERPDFKLCFDILRKNRAIYNKYNDSIFLIKDHAEWVNFFRHRALKNHRIYLANQGIINSIDNYFDQDTACRDTTACYEMFDAFYRYYYALDSGDPFINKAVYRVLERYDKLLPEDRSYSYYINRIQSHSNYHTWNMVQDTTYLRRAYECECRMVADSTLPMKLAARAYLNSSITLLLKNHIMTYDEYRKNIERLREFVGRKEFEKEVPDDLAEECRKQLDDADENFIFDVYFGDTTVLKRSVADSMMVATVNKNMAKPRLDNLSYFRTLILKMYQKMMSRNEARELAMERYRKVFANVRMMTPNDDELNKLLQPYLPLSYINDKAYVGDEKKRRLVKRLCRDIAHMYQNRIDQQQTTSYIKNLNNLFFFKPLMKYLTPRKRLRFLNELCVATQVTTYAHSVHVAKIAKVVMKGVLKHKPELLVGTLGCRSVEEVKKQKKMFMTFIKGAAMYHDIGKNSIAAVVNNDYRPTTDEEYAIIKKHPEMGVKYLQMVPGLEKYHDTTLGHHKWYNGKGGYPEGFDNTKSAVRILIDIITLSDCMQAATESVGRNYKYEKTFDGVMEEFRKDAGIRYNPELVELIDSHKELARKLDNLVDAGWVNIYYDIYKQYLR